jgi:histidinol-phosphate aminotransferase
MPRSRTIRHIEVSEEDHAGGDVGELLRRSLRVQRGRSALFRVVQQPGDIKLDANESPWLLSEEARKGIRDALVDLELHRYPDPRAKHLRAAIADWLGLDDVGHLALGNGSDEVLGQICAAFGEPRDDTGVARILYPSPSFDAYRMVAVAHACETIEVPMADDFEPDREQLDEAIRHYRPNIVFLATPNNPTGIPWNPDDVVRLALDHPDVMFVVDEAYISYADIPSCMPLALMRDNVICVGTVSKIGLAGLRVGFAVARSWTIGQLDKVRMPYNVNELSQRAAVALLTTFSHELEEHQAAIRSERARVLKALAEICTSDDFRYYRSQANFVCLRVKQAGHLHRFLVKRRILVRVLAPPGAKGALAGCVRVAIGTPAENDALLDALRAYQPQGS